MGSTEGLGTRGRPGGGIGREGTRVRTREAETPRPRWDRRRQGGSLLGNGGEAGNVLDAGRRRVDLAAKFMRGTSATRSWLDRTVKRRRSVSDTDDHAASDRESSMGLREEGTGFLPRPASERSL